MSQLARDDAAGKWDRELFDELYLAVGGNGVQQLLYGRFDLWDHFFHARQRESAVDGAAPL
jgi:hypothetical protein